jgi:UDP-N-acetylglucosamine 1-carboxyvinyltransferase
VGNHIYFDVVSVGATINVMLAAVRAKGLTILENVAKEPHIVDLANFLNSLGADIRGAGTDVIKIHGAEQLHGTNYSIIPDQIEAGTYMVAAAATKGNVLIRNVIPKHMEAITEKLVKTGVSVVEYDDAIRVSGEADSFQHVNVKTMPYPGFPTDMQPQMTTFLSLAEGTSIVTEGVWDNRFKYISELCRMGASISVDGKVAVVQGVPALSGASVRAADLRAGAALVIAGLSANGRTEIEEDPSYRPGLYPSGGKTPQPRRRHRTGLHAGLLMLTKYTERFSSKSSSVSSYSEVKWQNFSRLRAPVRETAIILAPANRRPDRCGFSCRSILQLDGKGVDPGSFR